MRSRLVALSAVFLALIPIMIPVAQSQAAVLPTLTTTRAAHQLTLKEAARGYPVHLLAVVTYYDPYIDPRHAALFVSEATGGVFVALTRIPVIPLQAGELVEVTGVSGTGDFAPIVARAEARVAGRSPLPYAPRVNLTQMLTSAEDGQWVEVEGVVRASRESGKNVFLNLELSDGNLTAAAVKQPGADYASLVDAKVTIRGNTAPIFNRHMQEAGARLLFPGLGSMTVEDPAPAHPFATPVSPVVGLLRFTAITAFRHRVHIRGNVTLLWPGRLLCIQDGAGGLCAQADPSTPLKPGELVDVIGFPTAGEFTPTLTNATYEAAGGGRAVRALSVTAAQALRGDHDAELVVLDGKLIGEDKAAKDPTIVLSSGKFIFSAVGPSELWAQLPSAWEAGSTLRITGICAVQADTDRSSRSEGFSVPKSFRIMFRSPADVVVVQRPSWWTAAHALRVLALALFIIVLAAVALIGQVRQGRTTASKLRLANDELFRLATVDGLTGVANRRTFDREMEREWARLMRTTEPLSLLLLDVDHFKMLNDSEGHQCGDECLVRVALELRQLVERKTDLVARYGGEEFGIMLAATGEADAMRVANAVCLCLAGLGLSNPRSPVAPTVTVSIGVATAVRGYFADVAAFLAAADRALYTAKHLGRNRVVFFSQTEDPEERQELRDPGRDRDHEVAGRAGGA